MRRFRFRFEAVENVRKMRQEEALSALAAAQRALQAEIAARDELAKTLQQALANREALGTEPADYHQFQLINNFIIGTKQRVSFAENAIRRAQRAVQKAMERYLYMRRQKRMIEVLREKDFEEYKRQAAKHEQSVLDDLNVMRARLGRELE